MRLPMRIALVSITAAVAVLAIAVGAFLSGLVVSGEFLRVPLERTLTAAFGVPVRIEGPLMLHTGLSTTVTADALVISDPSGPAGATFARATRPGARIDLRALLRRVVALEDVTGEELMLTLMRRADGSANWSRLFASSPGGQASSFAFAGIARLHVARVAGSYQREGAARVPFVIAGLDGSLPLREPIAARGSVRVADYDITVDLRTASLAELKASGAPIHVQGTLDGSGVRASLDGSLASDGSRADLELHGGADDARLLFDGMGVALHQPARLDVRGQLVLTATEAVARDVAVTLGKSVAAGSGRVDWSGPRLRVTADVAGERFDLDPLFSAASVPAGASIPRTFLEMLERVATSVDADVRLAVSELAGLPAATRNLKFQGRSSDRVVAVSGEAHFAGTPVKATLDYDARKTLRNFAVRIDGGAASTTKLRGATHPSELSGNAAGIRAQLRGEGANPRAVVASLQGTLQARDLHWTLARRGASPVSGRIDLLRVAIRDTRTTSAEMTGKLGEARCSATVSGGALASLLEGESWPLQIAGSCPGERISAKGRIALGQRHVDTDLSFDASADRIGAAARALGIPRHLPPPLAARGTLVVDDRRAQAKFAVLRLGRSAGSGEIAIPLNAREVPRMRLTLTTLNLDEINAVTSVTPAPTDVLERELPGASLRLPDVDLAIEAGRVDLGDADLRHLHLSGSVRAGNMPPARFQFEWEGVPLSGQFGANFSGAAPRAQFEAAAQHVDLGAVFARLGWNGIALRAGLLSVRGRAEGTKLGDLLASTTLDIALDRGRFDLQRRPGPGLPGRGDFSATLKAAPGKPTTLVAHGAMDAETFDVTVDASPLAGFLRADVAMPVTLRASIGDVSVEASGSVLRNGAGDGHVKLSGGRLDRLGTLLGLVLPEVQPYAASSRITISAGAMRLSDLDASFGHSHVSGELDIRMQETGRRWHLAKLRMPALHLEDIGAARWLRGALPPQGAAAREAPAARGEEAEIAGWLDTLRANDVDATVDIDALHGGGKPFASGRLRATLDKGKLLVQLQDIRTTGGGFDANIRVDASASRARFVIQARVRNLDYGPLAQTVDPSATMAGRLDLDVDLAAEGLPESLLPSLRGSTDAAVYPRGLQSDALKFWGTGLLQSIVRQVDPDARSDVECSVASFDIANGMLESAAFFVDTTHTRILGELQGNLMTRQVSGRLRPLSKRPALFRLAPTMLIGGTIEDPSLTAAPENLLLVPLRFANPLSGFADNWHRGHGPSGDATAGCREAFDRIRKARSEATAAKPG